MDSGIPADHILVDVLPAAVPAVSQAGLAALVDADHAADLATRHNQAGRDPADSNPPAHIDRPGDGGHTDREPTESTLADEAGIVAVAALSSWLGARVVRTRHPVPVRRALDMTASVRGTRRPARTIRGLA